MSECGYVHATGCVYKPEDSMNSLLYFFIASRGQTQVIRFARQAPLLAEPSHLRLQKKKTFFFLFFLMFLVAAPLGGV